MTSAAIKCPDLSREQFNLYFKRTPHQTTTCFEDESHAASIAICRCDAQQTVSSTYVKQLEDENEALRTTLAMLKEMVRNH
jgi:PleD family two-component response regulator